MNLTRRELSVAALHIAGASMKQTAAWLGLSVFTVGSYRKRVARKYRERGDRCDSVPDLERLLARDYPPRVFSGG